MYSFFVIMQPMKVRCNYSRCWWIPFYY